MSKLDKCYELLKENDEVTMIVDYKLAEELYDVIEGTIRDENNKWIMEYVDEWKHENVIIDIYNQLDSSETMVVEKIQYEGKSLYNIESLYREDKQIGLGVVSDTLYIDDDIDIEKLDFSEVEFMNISIIKGNKSVNCDEVNSIIPLILKEYNKIVSASANVIADSLISISNLKR